MPISTSTEPHGRRLLLVQTGFISDVVFTSPLVHALKRHDPQAEVTLLVRAAAREVAECIPELSGTIGCRVNGNQRWPRGMLGLRRALERGGFDTLICPDRSLRAALLAGFSGVPRRIGFRSRLSGWAFTEDVKVRPDGGCRIDQDLRLLDVLQVPAAGNRLRLLEPRDQEAYVQGFYQKHGLARDSKLAALCVGSFWPARRWPPVYFASLAEALLSRGFVPILFGGPAEAALAIEIAQARGGALASCLGNRLIQSAALLARCQLAVGGDSGLTHMARALGVPTVVVFGPTDPRTHAYEERTRVLSAKVRCRPCSSNGPRRCREGHHDCMRLISPEHVLDALDSLVDLQTPPPAELPAGTGAAASGEPAHPQSDHA